MLYVGLLEEPASRLPVSTGLSFQHDFKICKHLVRLKLVANPTQYSSQQLYWLTITASPSLGLHVSYRQVK